MLPGGQGQVVPKIAEITCRGDAERDGSANMIRQKAQLPFETQTRFVTVNGT